MRRRCTCCSRQAHPAELLQLCPHCAATLRAALQDEEPATLYAAALAHMKARRARLNAAIAAIERCQSITSARPQLIA